MKPDSILKKQPMAGSIPDAVPGVRRSPKALRSRKRERGIALAALILILGAWVLGYTLEKSDIAPYLQQAQSQADRIEKAGSGNYAAYTRQPGGSDQLIGYMTTAEASGYGGPMNLAVATDLEGQITGLAVIRHRETPNWFRRVLENDYISSLVGKSYSDPFVLGLDVDGVSGATYTSRALAGAALEGSRHLARTQLNFQVPDRQKPGIELGIPEILLLVLFALGILGRSKGFAHRKSLRWITMLTGMMALGFVYTNPLTLSLVNKLLLGFWPDWHTHLYGYLLVSGILFTLTVRGKNPYCEWFCPFGAAQECMGRIGGARPHALPRYISLLKWLPRILALGAILIALVFRNPGISSYEIFGTLFDLKGNITQFFLLGLVMLAALFIHRPWCRYFCPIKPVDAFIRFFRSWIKDLVPLWKKRSFHNGSQENR